MGIVTLIAKDLARIKPTEPLRLAKREAHKKRNFSDSSGNSSDSKVLIDTIRSSYDDRQEHDGIRTIRVYLTIIRIFILVDLLRTPSG
jgi:hypothetical protein